MIQCQMQDMRQRISQLTGFVTVGVVGIELIHRAEHFIEIGVVNEAVMLREIVEYQLVVQVRVAAIADHKEYAALAQPAAGGVVQRRRHRSTRPLRQREWGRVEGQAGVLLVDRKWIRR